MIPVATIPIAMVAAMTPVMWAQTIGSAALVVSLMISVGLQLEPAQIVALSRRPRVLIAAALVNVVVIPALAWAMCVGLGLSAEATIGVMLCAAAPGGPISALFSDTARADLVLAASMTILLPAIGVVATPLLLSMSVDLPAGARMPVAPMVVTLVVLQVIPLGLAMLVRRHRPALAERMAPRAQTIANATLGLLVVGLGIMQGHVLLELDGPTWLTLVGVTVLALGLGYVAAGPERGAARSGALIAACRNVSVAIMLASAFFPDPVVNATVLSFGLVTSALPFAVAKLWQRRGAADPR